MVEERKTTVIHCGSANFWEQLGQAEKYTEVGQHLCDSVLQRCVLVSGSPIHCQSSISSKEGCSTDTSLFFFLICFCASDHGTKPEAFEEPVTLLSDLWVYPS